MTRERAIIALLGVSVPVATVALGVALRGVGGPGHPPQRFPEPPPAPVGTVPEPVTMRTTWATIVPPGDVSTEAERLHFVAEVLRVHDGEPRPNLTAAEEYGRAVARELSRTASIPLSAITVRASGNGVGLTVRTGTRPRVRAGGRALRHGVCSEPFLVTAVASVRADPTIDGVTSVMCFSDVCMALADMRPTRPRGGFFYGGDACLHVDELSALMR